MLVLLISDYSGTAGGFNVSYTSTGSAYCEGTTNLSTLDYGDIEDGSGTDDYCYNQNCEWLIQPPQATSVTLTFYDFELEEPSPDGSVIYDAVEIYDGTSTSDPLLGTFTGKSIPSDITTTGGSMLIRFYSDLGENYAGWSAFYSSTQDVYCDASTLLTTNSGIINAGSGINDYANNTDCSWLIQPANVSDITLSFVSLDSEEDYDGVIVYDGADNSADVLGTFSGTSTPPDVTSTGASMYVEFLSDPALREGGFEATYTSSTTVDINELNQLDISVYQNHSNGNYTIDMGKTSSNIVVTTSNLVGQQISSSSYTNQQLIDFAIDAPSGVYLLTIVSDGEKATVKVVKE